jgi:hypothetical protein
MNKMIIIFKMMTNYKPILSKTHNNNNFVSIFYKIWAQYLIQNHHYILFKEYFNNYLVNSSQVQKSSIQLCNLYIFYLLSSFFLLLSSLLDNFFSIWKVFNLIIIPSLQILLLVIICNFSKFYIIKLSCFSNIVVMISIKKLAKLSNNQQTKYTNVYIH